MLLSQMLDHANPRDLNQSELDALEALIDAAGIEAVVQGLSEICGVKAEHIASNWQDTALGLRFHHPRLAKKKNRKGSFLVTKVEFQKLFRAAATWCRQNFFSIFQPSRAYGFVMQMGGSRGS